LEGRSIAKWPFQQWWRRLSACRITAVLGACFIFAFWTHASLFCFSPCPQALFDLEATNAELKGDLRDLWIAGAQVSGCWVLGKSAGDGKL